MGWWRRTSRKRRRCSRPCNAHSCDDEPEGALCSLRLFFVWAVVAYSRTVAQDGGIAMQARGCDAGISRRFAWTGPRRWILLGALSLFACARGAPRPRGQAGVAPKPTPSEPAVASARALSPYEVRLLVELKDLHRFRSRVADYDFVLAAGPRAGEQREVARVPLAVAIATRAVAGARPTFRFEFGGLPLASRHLTVSFCDREARRCAGAAGVESPAAAVSVTADDIADCAGTLRDAVAAFAAPSLGTPGDCPLIEPRGALELRGRCRVRRSVTLPPGVVLRFSNDPKRVGLDRLVVDPGARVTIEGDLHAPRTQIFAADGPQGEIRAPGLGRLGTAIVPQWWGAVADDRENDTDAFARLSSFVNASGGGTVLVSGGTYVVGQQELMRDDRGLFLGPPRPILGLFGCPRPVVVRGELDARGRRPILRGVGGARFGLIRRAGGPGIRAFPYRGMIHAGGNHDLLIENLELDGNMAELVVGGPYGDQGIQLPGSGLLLVTNGRVVVRNVEAHHHPLDGITMIHKGLRRSDPEHPHTFERVHATYNGRQGLSWVGGNHLVVKHSTFSHTGRGKITSSPAAGIDLEPEESIVENGLFEDVRIEDNVGPGVVSESSLHARTFTFRRFKIWGGAQPAVVMRSPRARFEEGQILGAVIGGYGSADPAEATQFIGVTFEDLPYRTPSDQLRPMMTNRVAPILTLQGENVLIDRCRITAHAGYALRLAGAAKPAVVRRTTIVAKNDRKEAPAINVAVLGSVHLEDVKVVIEGEAPMKLYGHRVTKARMELPPGLRLVLE